MQAFDQWKSVFSAILLFVILLMGVSVESFALSDRHQREVISTEKAQQSDRIVKEEARDKEAGHREKAKEGVEGKIKGKIKAKLQEQGGDKQAKENEKTKKDQWDKWLESSKKQIGVGISGSLEKRINALDGSNLLDDPSGVLAEEELNEGL